jgi:hypothetical protein
MLRSVRAARARVNAGHPHVCSCAHPLSQKSLLELRYCLARRRRQSWHDSAFGAPWLTFPGVRHERPGVAHLVRTLVSAQTAELPHTVGTTSAAFRRSPVGCTGCWESGTFTSSSSSLSASSSDGPAPRHHQHQLPGGLAHLSADGCLHGLHRVCVPTARRRRRTPRRRTTRDKAVHA